MKPSRGASPVLEVAAVDRMTAGLPRSPFRLHAPHEADAELLRLPGVEGVLVLKADGVAEEIAAGLYEEPELIGWMTVTAAASDLAAVGAEPVGVLLAQTLPEGAEDAWVEALQDGVARACATYALPVFGGDTSRGPVAHMVALAVGRVRDGTPLTRVGAAPGDRLYASGPLGAGNAFAYERLVGGGVGDAVAPAADPMTAGGVAYRPRARLPEGRLLRGLASACIDTSDGALAAVDELARRSGVGFALDAPFERALEGNARALAREADLPPLALLAGQHGEFELLFTVPEERVARLEEEAGRLDWRPVPLGRALREPGVRVVGGEGAAPVDTARLRNLAVEHAGDAVGYARAVLAALDRRFTGPR